MTTIFGNCIYGIDVTGKFNMKEKFLHLPGVQKMLNLDGEGFEIEIQQSYCYE